MYRQVYANMSSLDETTSTVAPNLRKWIYLIAVLTNVNKLNLD